MCFHTAYLAKFLKYYLWDYAVNLGALPLAELIITILLGDLQDGRAVRRGDHLPPHEYIRNTSTCGTTPTEHLLNAGRRPQTSQKIYIYIFSFFSFCECLCICFFVWFCQYSFAFTICLRFCLSVFIFYFFSIVFSTYHWWICFLVWLLCFFFLSFSFSFFITF